MDRSSRRVLLVLALILQLLISVDDNENWVMSFLRKVRYGVRHSAATATSPLAGTKIRQPWPYPSSSAGVQPGRRYIPSVFDVHGEPNLTKLLDVGACNSDDVSNPNTFSYVPPLDGTNPNYKYTLCQEFYGMRFVLFDLKLVNIDTVDSLSGSFTAQFQLVFHWIEGWEAQQSDDWFAYGGDEIETAENATLCGFDCDTTSTAKTMCCDRMWVPPLQVPSCKVNDVQSLTPKPYLTTTYGGSGPRSFWPSPDGNYTQYSARRTWYVGLDVTCPFTPDFRNFPFDHQFLTVDIVNPYASRTWLQLNKGFLEANIVDSISGIDLSPDDKIDGWSIEDLTVSSACGTQQTWKPTFLTQDYLLQILGVDYQSQNDTIMALLKDIKCAKMKNLIWNQIISLSIPTNKLPYNQTRNDYMQRLDATIAKYKECTSSKFKEFNWNDGDNLPPDVVEFKLNNSANVNRSFSFLDLEYHKTPSDGVNFKCLIDAIANLTTPGIRINIVIQRFTRYYIVKLFLPTFACVAFSFTSFALSEDELLGRLTVIVPSAIALSALQGFVVATDIPAVAYIAPTTWIIILSYCIQLFIALECIGFRIWKWIYKKSQNPTTIHQSSQSMRIQVLSKMIKWINSIKIVNPHKAKQVHHQCNENANVVDPQLNEDTSGIKNDRVAPQLNKARQGKSLEGEKKESSLSASENDKVDQLHENHQGKQGASFKEENEHSRSSATESNQVDRLPQNHQGKQGESPEGKKQQLGLTSARKIDVTCCGVLFGIYVIFLALLGVIPLLHAEREKEKKFPCGYESLWN